VIGATPDAIQMQGPVSQAPDAMHLLGTDPYGRDVLARLLVGARVSLSVGAGAVLVALTLGTLWGGVAGFAGGLADRVLMRTVDVLLAIPRVLVLLVLITFLGSATVPAIVLIIGATGWLGTSRLVRNDVRARMSSDYVTSARLLGIPAWRVLAVHVLPGVVPQLLVVATLAFAAVIPIEAALSFLNFGVRIPQASWGSIIHDGADRPMDHWWLIVFPSLAIITTVLCVQILGAALERRLAKPGRILA
jgi:peptide/nickel transport system permease protein